MSDSEWQQNMTRSLEKWGPKTDRRLRMVAIPVNNGDVEDALAENAALRAEVERLKNDLRRATDLLSSAKHGYRSDSPMRAAITGFLTAPADEEGRDE